MPPAPDSSAPTGRSRWEQTLRTVPGVDVPDRDTVAGVRWLRIAGSPPVPADVLLVDTEKTQVYFSSSTVEAVASARRCSQVTSVSRPIS